MHRTKEARQAYQAQYRAAHVQKRRAYGRAWYLAHQEECRLKNRERRYRRYGITIEQYDALLEKQGGRCAVCHTAEPLGKGRFHLDHDHRSGRVRGILCHLCNTALGRVERFDFWHYVQPLHPSVLD